MASSNTKFRGSNSAQALLLNITQIDGYIVILTMKASYLPQEVFTLPGCTTTRHNIYNLALSGHSSSNLKCDRVATRLL